MKLRMLDGAKQELLKKVNEVRQQYFKLFDQLTVAICEGRPLTSDEFTDFDSEIDAAQRQLFQMGECDLADGNDCEYDSRYFEEVEELLTGVEQADKEDADAEPGKACD